MPISNGEENKLNNLIDDLFSIIEEENSDEKMLKRLTDAILEDFQCTEVSLWTINRNNKWVDGTPRSSEDKYLSTSLIWRSESDMCKYEFAKKQEFTHSLMQQCLFAKVVNNVSKKNPFTYFTSEEAINEGFTSKDYIEEAHIHHIYVIPVTKDDKKRSSKEAIAIIELSFSDTNHNDDVSRKICEYAKRIHSVFCHVLRNYSENLKQRLINGLLEAESMQCKSIYESIIDIIRVFLPCQGVSIFLKDSFRNNYYLKTTTGVCYSSSNKKVEKENYDNVWYQKGEGLTGMVAENGNIFISDDLLKDKERPHKSKTYENVQGDKDDNTIEAVKKVKTGMFVPIHATQDPSNIIAIIRLVNKNNKCNSAYVDFFNDVDADVMGSSSRFLSAIIESRLNAEQLRSFESRVSHEMRRPTGIILFNASRLKTALNAKEMYEGEVKEKLEMIEHQAERQKHNLQVIKILYGEGYSSRNHADWTDLQNVISKSWEETEPLANQNGSQIQKISIEVPENKYLLRVDADAFIMAFSNLFENAIKYQDMTEDSSLICVTATLRTDGSLHIFVADNGVGIALNDKESVFNEGYRGRNIKDSDGAGLGLPTVKRIIEDYKGTVGISKERKPTKFEIILPKEIVFCNNSKK